MNKTKRLIFESAVKVFSSYGYTGATMDEVVSKAGVAKGTLYYHFKSKEDLFYFVIEEGINLINKEVYEATLHILNPLDKLKVSAKVQLKYVYENKDLFKVIMSQLWGTEERHNILREKVRKLLKESENKFKQAIDSGYIENEDPVFLSYSFLGMLFASAVYELLEVDYDYEIVLEKFMSFYQIGGGFKQIK